MADKKPEQIKGDSLLIGNYAHPATILGGAVGAFTGSEIADKYIPRLDTTELKVIKRYLFKPNVTEFVHTPEANRLVRNLGRNLLRGGTAALGVGVTAAGVKKFREHQEKQASFDSGENFANAQMNVLQQTHAMTMANSKSLIKKFKQPTTVGIQSPIAQVG